MYRRGDNPEIQNAKQSREKWKSMLAWMNSAGIVLSPFAVQYDLLLAVGLIVEGGRMPDEIKRCVSRIAQIMRLSGAPEAEMAELFWKYIASADLDALKKMQVVVKVEDPEGLKKFAQDLHKLKENLESARGEAVLVFKGYIDDYGRMIQHEVTWEQFESLQRKLANEPAPKEATKPEMPTSEWYTEAERKHDEGDDDEAIRLLKQLVNADPAHVDGCLLLGWLQLKRGNAGQAIDCFSRWIARPDHPAEASIGLGFAFAMQDNQQAARSAFEIVNLESGGDPHPWTECGRRLTCLRMDKEARFCFMQANALGPSNTVVKAFGAARALPPSVAEKPRASTGSKKPLNENAQANEVLSWIETESGPEMREKVLQLANRIYTENMNIDDVSLLVSIVVHRLPLDPILRHEPANMKLEIQRRNGPTKSVNVCNNLAVSLARIFPFNPEYARVAVLDTKQHNKVVWLYSNGNPRILADEALDLLYLASKYGAPTYTDQLQYWFSLATKT